MQIDITNIISGRATKMSVEGNVTIPEKLLNDPRLSSLEDIKFNGSVLLDEENEIILIGNITGIMILKDDLTGEPVENKFTTSVEENLEKFKNILDITDILWQNILVEIPSKVRSTDEDIYPSGDGWRVISETEYEEEKNKSNNPFASLGELLKTKEDK